MRLKYTLGILAIILLFACTPKEEDSKKLLSSGIQYIGNQEKIVTELDKSEIENENLSTINLELEDYKLIIIEPNYIERISKDKVTQALNNDFYIFFINIEDSRLIPEQYLNTITYNERKQEKIWTEQLYLMDGQLKSIVFPTEPNIEEELLNWLQYFDKYKEDSE
ncbi:hypothetical protein [Paucisalibacillus sp. EB02]|uniref:hypothetical protein n=1 Tax=Paucisalibacillus sp. EB02 TaxID=1347087 RepID=UPI0005A7882F|nr:hypothetical protein [Paucisalibacillus sp. EB02]